MFPRPILLLLASLAPMIAGCSTPVAPATKVGSVSPVASAPSTSVTPRSEGRDTSRGHNDPHGLWQRVDDPERLFLLDPEELLGAQQDWARAIYYDFPIGSDISCDPRTFLPLEQGTMMQVGVETADHALARQAMAATVERLGWVTVDDGEELPRPADWDDERYSMTSPYISEPEQVGQVVGISNIDTEGEIQVWFERTVLRIIAEELRRAGAVPARIVPFITPEDHESLRADGVTLPTLKELGY